VGEAFRVAIIGYVEHLLSVFDDLGGHAVMQRFRGEQGDAAVMMLAVVPSEELPAKGACVLDGAEAVGELGPILEGFELALRVEFAIPAWPTLTI